MGLQDSPRPNSGRERAPGDSPELKRLLGSEDVQKRRRAISGWEGVAFMWTAGKAGRLENVRTWIVGLNKERVGKKVGRQ